MDIVITTLKYLLLPALLSVFMYYLGRYRERASQKIKHDKEIFGQIDRIINAEQVTAIVENAGKGYLLDYAHKKSDDL